MPGSPDIALSLAKENQSEERIFRLLQNLPIDPIDIQQNIQGLSRPPRIESPTNGD